MRLAVLSDIHGNDVALEAVLAHLGAADKMWVLGDLAQFGAQPGEAIEQVRALPDVEVIQGNTDRYLATGVRPGMPPARNAGDWARMASRLALRDATFQWTIERLDYEQVSYLDGLPTELTFEVDGYGTLTAFHAVPGDDEFVLTADADAGLVGEKLAGVGSGLAMMGHTHIGVDRDVGDWRLLNVGSVGMPFDGDPRASYAILDVGEGGKVGVALHRVTYDVEAAADRLHAVGYPAAEFQAARLRHGLAMPPAATG